MTAQITDTFKLDGTRYALVGRRGGKLFEPVDYGVPTRMMHTACWRGYVATYSITDALRLEEVELQMAEPDPERTLLGAAPASYDRGRAHYRDLAHVFDYTGGILLGDGFIRELYVHMGFHPPHKWRTVHELIFDRGRVTARHDRSAAMAAIRERLAGNPLAPGAGASEAELRDWIAGAFSLEY